MKYKVWECITKPRIISKHTHTHFQGISLWPPQWASLKLTLLSNTVMPLCPFVWAIVPVGIPREKAGKEWESKTSNIPFVQPIIRITLSLLSSAHKIPWQLMRKLIGSIILVGASNSSQRASNVCKRLRLHAKKRPRHQMAQTSTINILFFYHKSHTLPLKNAKGRKNENNNYPIGSQSTVNILIGFQVNRCEICTMELDFI